VQDPTLLLALSTGSIDDVLEGATFVKVTDNTLIGGDSLATLMFTASDGRIINLAFDAKTSLLRQARYDLSDLLRKRGAEKVNKALITISYDQVSPGVATDASQFAWMPPANAQQASDADNEAEAALALQGKPASDFSLPGMDGKTVTLASLKGNVVLLDFWATWCGPCVMSLPELDALYQARKDGAVRIFAVNAGEEKEEVAAFLKAKNLTLPVLLDSEHAVTEKFGVGGFPTTIIIAPNGVVSKVFVGVPRGGKLELEQALDRAAAK
jgi:peroxiredoxin